MPGRSVQLIVRYTESGFYATSPQAPGLAYGRSTIEELRAELQDVLAFHFNEPGPFEVHEHHERHHDLGYAEIVVRAALDDHRDARNEAYMRIGSALTVPDQAESLAISAPRNRVGEVLYICAVPTDTLEWVVAQLDPRGEAALLAVAIAEELLFTKAVYTGGESGPRSEPVGEARTVGELMRASPILRPVQLSPLAV